MDLPVSYITSKFYSYSDNIRETSTYLNGCCPICREGKSWGIKRRLFYKFNDNYLFCHNCGHSWTPYYWVKEVTGMNFKEILEELKDYDYDAEYKEIVDRVTEASFELPPLPGEYVDLQDSLQLEYYKNLPIVGNALHYCTSRRLFSAINRPKTLYVCIKDKFHGNRLIIPFFDDHGKVVSYISRKLLNSDTKSKYLKKFGSDSPIFNIDKVDENYPYIFVFEGQIDAMFVKNGIAISGVHLTDTQQEILTTRFPFHQIVWVLDNYRFEKEEVRNIIINKLRANEKVFLYENEFSTVKDINEFCVQKKQDFVDPVLILKYSYSGDSGLLRLD